MAEPDSARSLAQAHLKQEMREGTDPKPKRPRTLSLDNLTEEPAIFQMRTLGGSLDGFDEHVAKLLSRLRQKRPLLPILIWWTGQRWVILDGHHRLAAYHLHAEATDQKPVQPRTRDQKSSSAHAPVACITAQHAQEA